MDYNFTHNRNRISLDFYPNIIFFAFFVAKQENEWSIYMTDKKWKTLLLIIKLVCLEVIVLQG